jgi:hypothetical protein
MTRDGGRDGQQSSQGGSGVSALVVVVVTCERCGHSWQRRTVAAEQVLDCIFCGSRGRLSLGPVQVDPNGTQHAEAWLHGPRAS